VARQYTGTAGRTANAQVAVYLTYAAPGGHALIDRDLYLPQSWISDPGRCRAAGIPPGTGFATKPGLARTMIACALDAGTAASWVAGDETSDAVKLSSCVRKFPGARGECGGFVVMLAGGQAVVQAAEQAAEQVALGGGVPVAGVASPVVVGAGAG